VQRAEQGHIQEALVDPGRDADIIDAEVGRKGVGRFILPAALPVVPVAGDHFDAKIPLFLFVIFQVQETIINLGLLGNRLDQFDLLRAQHRKDGLHLSRLHPGFETVQDDIIRVLVGGEELDISLAQIDDLFQVRLEDAEVIFSPGLGPGAKGG
jgi:hypothetical protein